MKVDATPAKIPQRNPRKLEVCGGNSGKTSEKFRGVMVPHLRTTIPSHYISLDFPYLPRLIRLNLPRKSEIISFPCIWCNNWERSSPEAFLEMSRKIYCVFPFSPAFPVSTSRSSHPNTKCVCFFREKLLNSYVRFCMSNLYFSPRSPWHCTFLIIYHPRSRYAFIRLRSCACKAPIWPFYWTLYKTTRFITYTYIYVYDIVM